MSVIKGLTGDLTVSVDGKAQAFVNYGVPASSQAYAILAGRTAVLEDPTTPESIAIVAQPARGKVVARADGRISLNLNEHPADTSDLTFDYARTAGGTTETIQATVTVGENLYKEAGWAKGRHYKPEVNPVTDAIIVEPVADVRKIHMSSSAGLSFSDILARHTGTGDSLDGADNPPSRADLSLTPARDGAGALISPVTRYGEIEALAVQKEVGERILWHYDNTDLNDPLGEEFQPYWLLFKKGDLFTGKVLDDRTPARSGVNALHPNMIGAYGTGARPKFTSDTFDATTRTGQSNWIFQDLHLDNASLALGGIGARHLIMDNIRNDNCRSRAEGANQMYNDFTMRRYYSTDSFPRVQKDGDPVWPDSERDDFSGARFNGMRYLYVEKSFISGAGWDFLNGYRPDRDVAAGKPPEIYSHAVYGDTNIHEATFKDCIFINSGHSALQLRSGGIVDNLFAAGNNTGYAPVGNGPTDAVALGGRGSPANWSLVNRYVQTQGGWKDWEVISNSGVIAGGLKNTANETSVMDSIVINWGPKTPYSDITAATFGQPKAGKAGDDEILGAGVAFAFEQRSTDPTRAMPLAGSFSRDELIVYNYNPDATPNQNDSGVADAIKDTLTINTYANTVMASSGEDLRSFDIDYLRPLDAPWEELDTLNDSFLSPFGKGRPSRLSATTVRFEPDAGSDTPGQLSWLAMDWHTKDLPGTVAGDSITLQGHDLYWNMTPENSIADFDFGGDCFMEMWGGALRPSTVTCDADGNDLRLYQGAKFDLSGPISTGRLNVTTYESRLSFSGAVADNWSAQIYGRSEFLIEEGGMATVASGETLTLGGHCKAGFDGVAGAAASLTIAGTLAFKRGSILNVTGLIEYAGQASTTGMRPAAGLPEIGDPVATGEGATALVSGLYQRAQRTDARYLVDEISGEIIGADRLLGPTWASGYYIGDSRNGIGAAGAADPIEDLDILGRPSFHPEYFYTSITEYTSGRNGTAAPNVMSSVTLLSGSTVTVDITGLRDGDVLTLIDVDTLTDNGATLPDGCEISGGTLTYTHRSEVTRIKGLVGIAAHTTPIARNFTNDITSYAVEGAAPAGFSVNSSTGDVDWTPTGNYDANVTIRGTHGGGTEDVVIALYATDAPMIVPCVGQSQFNAHQNRITPVEYQNVYIWRSSGVAEKAVSPFLNDEDGRNMPGEWAALISSANADEVVLLVPTYSGSTGVDVQWDPSTGGSYSTSVNRVSDAKTAFSNAPAISVVLGAHGGAATSATEAQMRIDMETFIDAYMTDIGATAGAVFLNGDIFNRGSSTNDELSAGIRSLALSRDRYAALDWFTGLQGVDNKHLTGKSMNLAARRMYQAYVDMLSAALPDAPEAPAHDGNGAFSLFWDTSLTLNSAGDDLRVDYNPFKGRLPTTVTLYYTVDGGSEQSQSFAYGYQGSYQVPGLSGGEALSVQATVTNANGESARSATVALTV